MPTGCRQRVPGAHAGHAVRLLLRSRVVADHARPRVQPARPARRRSLAAASSTPPTQRYLSAKDRDAPTFAAVCPVKLFVTGAAGFIGSNYVRWVLANSDHEITVFDKLTYAGNLDNIRDVLDDRRCRFVHGDICDQEAVLDQPRRPRRSGALRRRVARRPVDRRPVRVRAPPTRSARTCCATWPARSASSASCTSRPTRCTGRSSRVRSTRRDRLTPRSPYSAAKAGSDLIALSYHTTYGLPVVVTRCSNNYGPYQFPEKLIPLFTTNLLDGKQVPLMGDGGNVRDWIHVEDHNRAAHLVLERGDDRRDLQHRRPQRDHQPRDHRSAARAHRARRVVHRVGARPARARPALQRRDRQDHRPRLEARARLRHRAGAHGRLVPRPPRLVGAAQGARRSRLMRVLITGAGGQLGHDLASALCATPATTSWRSTAPQLDVGDRDAVSRCRRPRTVPTSSSTPPPGPPSTPARADPTRAFRDNADAVRWLREAC